MNKIVVGKPAVLRELGEENGQLTYKGQAITSGRDGVDGTNGSDGVSPVVTLSEFVGGTQVTITDADHPDGQIFDVLNGVDGAKGSDGTDGSDGVSPTVEISEITGGHRVTIFDATHPSGQYFDIMDGEDGSSGSALSNIAVSTTFSALPNNANDGDVGIVTSEDAESKPFDIVADGEVDIDDYGKDDIIVVNNILSSNIPGSPVFPEGDGFDVKLRFEQGDYRSLELMAVPVLSTLPNDYEDGFILLKDNNVYNYAIVMILEDDKDALTFWYVFESGAYTLQMKAGSAMPLNLETGWNTIDGENMDVGVTHVADISNVMPTLYVSYLSTAPEIEEFALPYVSDLLKINSVEDKRGVYSFDSTNQEWIPLQKLEYLEESIDDLEREIEYIRGSQHSHSNASVLNRFYDPQDDPKSGSTEFVNYNGVEIGKPISAINITSQHYGSSGFDATVTYKDTSTDSVTIQDSTGLAFGVPINYMALVDYNFMKNGMTLYALEESVFDRIENYYRASIWGQDKLTEAVVANWITESEYEELTGEAYSNS